VTDTLTYTGTVTFTSSDFHQVVLEAPPVAYESSFIDCTVSVAPDGFLTCTLFASGFGSTGQGCVVTPGTTYGSHSGLFPVNSGAPSSSIQMAVGFPQSYPWTVDYTIHVTYEDLTPPPPMAAIPSRLATIVG
jgi:hypothetical protein